MAETQDIARKLAAILAADVVGYSRLMGADEEGTAARLKSARADIVDPAIAANRGRIVKTTGDGLLAEFSSVVDAVRSALAIQAAMAARNAPERVERRLEYRIGIHLGDVLVQQDGDLLGDGVNIAARLEGIAAPGGVCLSEDAVHQVQGKIDATFLDAGRQSLKNIAQPMRVFTAVPGTVAHAKAPRLNRDHASRRGPWRWAVFFAGLVLVIVVARGAAWYFHAEDRTVPRASAPAAKEAPRFSIVVLPFANLSGDASQDYFADGITENLTTDLSRMRGMFVIARNTAFTYKGKNRDAKEIGQELNVRYVLEGSVQRDEDRVRVNAQLIDTSSGAHIWADRFDANRADLFKLQDDIVARLTNTLGYELSKAEQQRAGRSRNPDALELYLRGLAVYNQSVAGSDKDKIAEARALNERALKLDPDNVSALVNGAWLDFSAVAYGYASPDGHEAVTAEQYLSRAIGLDPDYGNAYVCRAMLYMVTRRTKDAIEEATKAIALNPSDPNGYGALAWAQSITGKDTEALGNIERAVNLSPRDPSIGFWLYLKGGALVDLRRYDDAIAALQQAIDAKFAGWPVYLSLAVANALKGDDDRAKAALAELRKRNPSLTIKSLHAILDLPQPFWDGMRKVGLPEG